MMDVVFCYTCVKAATQKKILKKMPDPAFVGIHIMKL